MLLGRILREGEEGAGRECRFCLWKFHHEKLGRLGGIGFGWEGGYFWKNLEAVGGVGHFLVAGMGSNLIEARGGRVRFNQNGCYILHIFLISSTPCTSKSSFKRLLLPISTHSET